MTSDIGFHGLRVASFESRMAAEMTRLISRYGGEPFVSPAIKEVPLHNQETVFEFGSRVLAREFGVVIFLTGVGTRLIMETLRTRYDVAELVQILSRITVVARGPKPLAALREVGLTPTIAVPEPNTWRELLQKLDGHQNLRGLRVAVQEYGTSNPDLLEGLRGRGAEVMSVAIYRWALPDDLGPLRQLLETILAGEIAVWLVTNAAQVEHCVRVLSTAERIDAFRKALHRMLVASIGPTASEHLRQYAFPVDLEPSHPKMGLLVKEASEQAATILAQKRHSTT